MKFQFLGAVRQVTGSQHLLQVGGTRILIDCGMYQERDFQARNWEPSPFAPEDIDALLLTHAHVDHCGRAPKLVAEGFNGPIFATAASTELVELILRDSAKIQAEDVEYKKRRHRKEGRRVKRPIEPLYSIDDVERTVPLLQPVRYEQSIPIGDDVSVAFHDAGHILGSAIIELKVRENGRTRRVLFSGDLGQRGKPIVRDPAVFAQADVVVMESTYGDREHEPGGDIETQIADAIHRTVEAGGNIVVPIFAIERAQEFLYHVSRLLHTGQVPQLPVFLDSPMAVDATAIFRRHRECFDANAWQLINEGRSLFNFSGLELVRSTEESKAINDHKGTAIILSTSGMCTAGRIKFHLRHNISRKDSTILFVGYQAKGTLGRQILEGRKYVRIHGSDYTVKARVDQIRGFSGHADRTAMMDWLGNLQTPPERLFLVHGEESQALAFAKHIEDTLRWNVTVPEYRDVVEIN